MPGTARSGGRNRKSRAAHAVTNTGRTDRGTAAAPARTSADIPDPPAGRPPTPKTLTGDTRAEWTRMADRLELAHTLSIVDDAALYQYCCLFAETEGLRAARRTNARLIAKLETALERCRHEDQIADVATAIAQVQKLDARHVQQLRQGHMAIRQYLVEFGMTPAARTRVEPAAAAPVANPIDRFTRPRPQLVRA
jgi:P27 family predicted phage terminase small subunit